jgi:hypothetical protein
MWLLKLAVVTYGRRARRQTAGNGEIVLLLDAMEDVVFDKDTVEGVVRVVSEVEPVVVGVKLVDVDTDDSEDGR